MTHPLISEMEKQQLKSATWSFAVGDTVDVRTKVREGDKERVSMFSGTVIGRQGAGLRQTFTVRRLVMGEGVERIFPLHSPNLVDVRVRHKGEVRRAKLNYLRDRVGKATRIKGTAVHTEEAPVPVAAAPKAESKES